ncbi:hypothetical protein NP493_308g02033 [Ridgeia piscesae]|uniref:Uncharacterized protein n=1 Tax=Ridgeia piscesae TaxID=27915 RepID=A0AAD9L5T2_RIDPI|nr:hypothetical protein NP493_308g02033 [Ridgeia piscesae]
MQGLRRIFTSIVNKSCDITSATLTLMVSSPKYCSNGVYLNAVITHAKWLLSKSLPQGFGSDTFWIATEPVNSSTSLSHSWRLVSHDLEQSCCFTSTFFTLLYTVIFPCLGASNAIFKTSV